MPKRPSEAYIDDDGFVEDAPVLKPSTKKKQKTSSSSHHGGSLPGGGQADKDGGEYWEISGKRRIQLSTFNGKQMLSIREYYEGKEGEMLPGKKGISLTMEQFDTVISLLPHVETVLKAKGVEVRRPEYGLPPSNTITHDEEEDEEVEVEEDDDDDEENDGEEGVEKGRKKGKREGRKKKNFEDTSEDE